MTLTQDFVGALETSSHDGLDFVKRRYEPVTRFGEIRDDAPGNGFRRYIGGLYHERRFGRKAARSFAEHSDLFSFHWSLAYSALACFRIGMSLSASLHSVRKSW